MTDGLNGPSVFVMAGCVSAVFFIRAFVFLQEAACCNKAYSNFSLLCSMSDEMEKFYCPNFPMARKKNNQFLSRI